MSKASSKINKIKRKLDNISGLEGDFVLSKLNEMDFVVDLIINEINIYLKQDSLNGTVWENYKSKWRGMDENN